jgi:Uma2 family endonuclease
MTLPNTPRSFSVDEYLMLERASREKSEYLDGAIYAMTGASRDHNHIVLNIAATLRGALRGSPCETFSNDLRVKVADSGLYTYPDVLVACPPISWDREHMDMLENPSVLVEVLSPSTELYDRNEKWARYQQLPSLQHYLLVAQNRVQIDHYSRDPRGWRIETLSKLDDVVQLQAIGAELSLSDVYERVINDEA